MWIPDRSCYNKKTFSKGHSITVNWNYGNRNLKSLVYRFLLVVSRSKYSIKIHWRTLWRQKSKQLDAVNSPHCFFLRNVHPCEKWITFELKTSAGTSYTVYYTSIHIWFIEGVKVVFESSCWKEWSISRKFTDNRTKIFMILFPVICPVGRVVTHHSLCSQRASQKFTSFRSFELQNSS